MRGVADGSSTTRPLQPNHSVPGSTKVLKFDAALLDAGSDLKVVANVAVGFNNIDVAACRARGVICTNTPDVLTESVADLLGEVEGSVAVIGPQARLAELVELAGHESGRVSVLDPLSAKGLEFDATVVVDPAAVVSTTSGGVRSLYVALTRAAHRMTVVTF